MKAKKNKPGLRGRDVAKDHFSSGLTDPADTSESRLIIRVLEGRSLLASDVETGKSDPICFIWFGSASEDAPSLEDLEKNPSVLQTQVCPVTTDPIWNENVTFKLGDLVNDTKELGDMRIIIFIRDQDIDKDADGNVSKNFDELGMLEISLKEIIIEGKIMKTSIVKAANWYNLQKAPGMRKVDGKIKLTISLIFVEKDTPILSCQILPEEMETENDNSAEANLPTLLKHFQNFMKSKSTNPSRAVPSSPGKGSLMQSLDGASLLSGSTKNDESRPYRAKSASPGRSRDRKPSLSSVVSEKRLKSENRDAAESFDDSQSTVKDRKQSKLRPQTAPSRISNRPNRYGSNDSGSLYSDNGVDLEWNEIERDIDGNQILKEELLSAIDDLQPLKQNSDIRTGQINYHPKQSLSNVNEDNDEVLVRSKRNVTNDLLQQDLGISDRRVVDRVGSDRKPGGIRNKYDVNSDYEVAKVVKGHQQDLSKENNNQNDQDEAFEFGVPSLGDELVNEGI